MNIPKFAKTTAVVVGSTILATLATNAVDMRGQFSSTLLGGVLSSLEEQTGPCPENMVLVTQALVPFCVDMYEASASDDCLYEKPNSEEQTLLNLTDPSCVPVSRPQMLPWRWVSQNEAQQACSRAGKRLLTAGEWYKAALGTNDDVHNVPEEQCNIERNRSNGPAETATGMRCVSDAGAYDMIGNVWEWVDGSVEKGEWDGREVPGSGYITEVDVNGMAYETAKKADERFGEDRFWSDDSINAGIMRGGYYDSRSHGGLYATYAASPLTFTGDAVGFRCAITPIGL